MYKDVQKIIVQIYLFKILIKDLEYICVSSLRFENYAQLGYDKIISNNY